MSVPLFNIPKSSLVSTQIVHSLLMQNKLMFCFALAAQINKQMPRTFGDSIIHQSHFDFAAHIDVPLPSHGGRGQTEQETKIGQLIAENLVDDGATLQMGIMTFWSNSSKNNKSFN